MSTFPQAAHLVVVTLGFPPAGGGDTAELYADLRTDARRLASGSDE